jgi:UDP-glucose 4-epimerase
MHWFAAKQDMRVLLPSGVGYIGSHKLLALLASNHDVCVFENFSNSSSVVIDGVLSLPNRQMQCYEGDVWDPAALGAVCLIACPMTKRI